MRDRESLVGSHKNQEKASLVDFKNKEESWTQKGGTRVEKEVILASEMIINVFGLKQLSVRKKTDMRIKRVGLYSQGTS